MANLKIKEMLEMIDAKINHIEDITADNREVIIKLVKQSNQIVKFLSQIEPVEEFETLSDLPLTKKEEERSNRIQSIKELIDEFMDKHKDLKELEKELKKNKVMLTPGQIGEA